jgi:hypothetical protein
VRAASFGERRHCHVSGTTRPNGAYTRGDRYYDQERANGLGYGGAAGRCGVRGRGIPLGDFWEPARQSLRRGTQERPGPSVGGYARPRLTGAASDATRAYLTAQALTAIQPRAAGSHRCPRSFLVTVPGAQDVGDVLRAHHGNGDGTLAGGRPGRAHGRVLQREGLPAGVVPAAAGARM